jgi:CTP synthase (UTP-ammonia lyase)
VVTPLSCALLGEKSAVRIMPGSRARSLYGTDQAIEEFWCSYGLDAQYGEAMTKAGFVVSGVDASGDARIVESPAHPFFVATLFLPQKRSEAGRPHPILKGFAALVNSPSART